MFDVNTYRPELANPALTAPISRLDMPADLVRSVYDNLVLRGWPVVEVGTDFIRARATTAQWAEFGTNPAITRQVES